MRDPGGRLLSEFRRRMSDAGASPAWLRDYVYAGDRMVASIQNPAPAIPGPVTTHASAPGSAALVRLTFPHGGEPDVNAYLITRSDGTSNHFFEVPAPANGEVTFEDAAPAVTEGQAYTYSIRARDGALNTSEPTRDYVVTPGDTAPPPAPGKPWLTAGDNTVALTWGYGAKPPDFYGYRLERRLSTADPNSWAPVTGQILLASRYTDGGLTNGRAYKYRVVAVDTAGLPSAPGLESTATPVDTVAPAAPQGLTVVPRTLSADLWWSASPEADLARYRVIRSDAPIDPNDVLTSCPSGTIISSGSITYLISGLDPVQTYYARLCAEDDDGNFSLQSEEIRFTTRTTDSPSVGFVQGSGIAYGVCSLGFRADGPSLDVAQCTLPGNHWDLTYGFGGERWQETPFSHLNYRSVMLTNLPTYPSEEPFPEPEKSGFRLYRRRGTGEPWRTVSAPTRHPAYAPPPGEWPVAPKTGDQSQPTAFFFDLTAAEICAGPYEFAVAGFKDVADPNTEGEMSAAYLAPPAPLPAPENVSAIGYRILPASPPGTAKRYAQVQWNGYKGGCRADFAGFRVYRQSVLGGPTPDGWVTEITNGTTMANVATLRSIDLPHNSPLPGHGFAVNITSMYRVLARAETSAGAVSSWSNAACFLVGAHIATENNEDQIYGTENYECTAGTLGSLVDAPISPPPSELPVMIYPGGGSCDVIGIYHGQLNWNERYNRIRVYRQQRGVPESRIQVATLPGDEEFFAPAGWTPRTGTAEPEEDPNPIAVYDPNVEYLMSYVDLMGQEGTPTSPVALQASYSGTLSPTNDGSPQDVGLEWSAPKSCVAGMQGFEVWRADISQSQANDCDGWQTPANPWEVITSMPATATSHVDVNPPRQNDNWLAYQVWAIGGPGDPTARRSTNRLCVRPNQYVRLDDLEGSPEGGWVSASAGAERLLTSPSRFIGQVPSSREVIFYHTDHLGTPVVITNESGQVLSKHKYFPFGEEMSPQGGATHTRRFTGHERDSESGLDYMLARYYTSTAGRFMSVDPGNDTTPLDPQSWNRFAYTRNNPLKFVDPDGEAMVCLNCAPSNATLAKNAETRQSFRSALQSLPVIGGALAKLGDAVASMVLPESRQESTAIAEAAVFGMAGGIEMAGAGAAKGASGLTGAQGKNLQRFEKNLPSAAGETAIHDLPAGGKAFQAEVPGNVAGSAVYEKQVDAAGKTMEYTKTTLDPSGKPVHVKDKIRGTTVYPPEK